MNATAEAPGLRTAVALAAALKHAWQTGKLAPDAAAAVAAHPSLAANRSVVIDLALEEYCLRSDAGSPIDAAAFCRRFPTVGASLGDAIAAYRVISAQPGEVAEPWPAAGERIEGVELVGELGRGACGRAYLGHDPGTGRACVVKLARGRSAEGRVIGRLRHPHVTDVYWSRPIGGRTAVCMPLVGVTTLADIHATAFPTPGAPVPRRAAVVLDAIANPPELNLPADRPPVVPASAAYPDGIAAVGARIAAALAHVHAAGVCHGDLKPTNVVVASGGWPYLIDFSLATDTPVVAGGTLAYMAPEVLHAVAAGVPAAHPDPAKADVYSFGAMLHELLTGRVPFAPVPGPPREAARELSGRVSQGLPPRTGLRTRRHPLEEVAVACLATDPADRPTAADVARRLDEWMTRRARLRRRAAVGGLVAVAVAGMVALVTPKPPPVSGPGPRLATAAEHKARGKLWLAKDRPDFARLDFAFARDGRADPDLDGLESYALLLDENDRDALPLAERAAARGPTAATLNNLGYALVRTGDPRAGLRRFEEAARLAPDNQAVLFNRAVGKFRLGLTPDGRVTDPTCPADMKRVLAGPPLPVPALRRAAHLFAAAAELDPEYPPLAVRCLADAIARGLPPDEVGRDPLLRARLHGTPGFAGLATLPAAPPEPRGRPFGLLAPD